MEEKIPHHSNTYTLPHRSLNGIALNLSADMKNGALPFDVTSLQEAMKDFQQYKEQALKRNNRYEIGARHNQLVMADTLLHFATKMDGYGKDKDISKISNIIRYLPEDDWANKLKHYNAYFPDHLPINLVQDDIVKYAHRLRLEYPDAKIAVLSPNNREIICGGAFSGAKALEEILSYCSSLSFVYLFHAISDKGCVYKPNKNGNLRPHYINNKGPKLCEVLYAKDVTFIKYPDAKDENNCDTYKYLDNFFKIDIIGSVAQAIEENDTLEIKKSKELINKREIYTQLYAAKQQNVDHLILTAFGCGAFKNDASVIAEYYKVALCDEAFAKLFTRVHFVINDAANYEKFSKVFSGFCQMQKSNEHKI